MEDRPTNFDGVRLTTLHKAILQGLDFAAFRGLTKHEDISFAIQVAIDNAGLKVIRAPKGRVPEDAPIDAEGSARRPR